MLGREEQLSETGCIEEKNVLIMNLVDGFMMERRRLWGMRNKRWRSEMK
jgi:hypothetical protein